MCHLVGFGNIFLPRSRPFQMPCLASLPFCEKFKAFLKSRVFKDTKWLSWIYHLPHIDFDSLSWNSGKILRMLKVGLLGLDDDHQQGDGSGGRPAGGFNHRLLCDQGSSWVNFLLFGQSHRSQRTAQFFQAKPNYPNYITAIFYFQLSGDFGTVGQILIVALLTSTSA